MNRHMFAFAKGLVLIFCLAAIANIAAAQPSDAAPDTHQQAEGDGDVEIQGTKVWTGGGADDNTSTNGNWQRGGPRAGDFLNMDNDARQTMTHDNAAGIIYLGMSISDPSEEAGFTINGNRFGVSNGGFISCNNISFLTINTDLDIYGEVTITTNSIVNLTGVIAGDGSLLKESSGSLNLSGNNTFTGGIDFEEGTIVAAHDNALGTGALRILSDFIQIDTTLSLLNGVNLANDINLDFSTNVTVEEEGVATLSGVIAGDYGIVLQNGHLILAGDNTFTGNVTLENSTLSMTRQLTTSDIYINEGGTLTGLFGGKTLHATQGNITPNGSDIGSMQVSQTFALDGSTLHIQLDNQGNADKIIAAAATLESGTILAKPTEAITGRRQYVIIQTTDGIQGDPADLTRQVDNDAFLLDFTLAIVGNNLVLGVEQGSSFEEAGRGFGNRQLSSIGLILDNAVSGGNDSDMLATLQGLEERELKTAMGQIQPKLSQAVAMRQMNTQANVNQQWQSRTQQAHFAMRNAIKAQESTWLAQGPSSPGSNPGQDSSAVAAAMELIRDNQPQVGKFVFFAKQLNDFGKVNEDRFASGYSYHAHGVDIGGQMLLSEHFLLGGSGTLNVNNISGHDGSGTAESLTLTANLYASYLTRNWQFDAGFSYGHAFNESQRPITALNIKADGDYDSDILAFTLGGAYTLDIQGWEINPFANISYTSVIDHAYTETGAGALNLSISQNHTDSLKPALGVRLGRRFAFNNGSVIAPRVSAAYEYEVLDTQVGVDANMLGGTFRNQGADINRHTVRLGAGGDLKLNKDLTLFMDYVASLNNDFVNHSINAGLRLSF